MNDDGTLTVLGLVEGQDAVTEIDIPETANGLTVTGIGANAFRDNKVLTSVTLPKTLTTIGEAAFLNCVSIDSIDLPVSLKEMGGGAYSGCDSIESVVIPGSLEMYEYSFRGCKALKSVTFEDGVQSIGKYGLADCPNLATVNHPNTLLHIEDWAFWGDSALTSIVIPEGVTRLSSNCFEDCTALTSVTLPASLENVDSRLATNVPSICTIYVKTVPQHEALEKENAFVQHAKIDWAEGYPKHPQSISMDQSSIELTRELGDFWNNGYSSSAELSLIVDPVEAADTQDVTWSTSDESVVTLDYNGVDVGKIEDGGTRARIRAHEPGTATITATVGDLTATCEVRVADLGKRTVLLNDTQFTCTATLDPGTSERWEVSDTSVARITASSSVDRGSSKTSSVTLTPLKTGETTVYCYVGDLMVYRCEVTVAEGDAYYLDEATVYGVQRSYPLQAGGVRPKPIVVIGGITLQEGVDYTLSYQNNNAVGFASVTITGMGQCVGTRTYTFQIVEGGDEPTNPGGTDTPTDPSGPGGSGDVDDPDDVEEPDDPDTPDDPADPEPAPTFPDVDPTQWYADSVAWAVENGIVNGYGDGTFGPERAVSRCEAAAYLWNAAGQPETEVDASALPSDVVTGEWYTEPVAWALKTGVFNGDGNGLFSPGGSLSREQAACVLYNRAAAAGEDVSARADLSRFSDSGALSGWAEDAMSWAVAEGVFNGNGEGKIEPGRAITRAELCAILWNCETRAE